MVGKFVLQALSELLYISYVFSRVFYSYLRKYSTQLLQRHEWTHYNLYTFQNVLPRSLASEASLLHRSGRMGTNV